MGRMTEVREYLDAEGNSPYGKWFDRLNVTAAVKVTTAVHRIEQGNFSNVKGLGAGVYEYRIGFWSWLSNLLRQGRGSVGDIASGRYQEAPGRGYFRRKRALARL